MPTPKAVIFDIGNVLITWDTDLVYAKVLPDPADRTRFFDETGLDDMNLAMDRGAPFPDTIFATAERHPDKADLIRLWHDRWIEMFTPRIDGSWTILRALREAGVPVFALSNFAVESFVLAERHYPELVEFDRRYISGQMKLIKPDPAIYQTVERDCGLSGADLFFIDDRADNIAAANARGWQTYHFGTAEALDTALRDTGLEY